MKKRLIISLILFLFFPFSTVLSSSFFLDVSPFHKNFLAITYLHQENILNGFSDGSFKPDIKINRAEIIKVLIQSSNIRTDGIPLNNPFPDVKRDAWFSPFVQKAKILDIVKGDKKGFFYPQRNVNKAEALKMIIKVNGIEIDEVKKNPFEDVSKKQWFAPYFYFAKKYHLIENQKKANPGDFLTRGQLAEIIFRLEKWKKNHHPDIGRASFYADYFEGKNTANGEVFSQKKFTAAHQTFAFNDRVLVTNLENRKSIVVKINDRGPYAEDNIIDLTKSAFENIAPLSRGVVLVNVKKMPKDFPLGSPSKESCQFDASNKKIVLDTFNGLTLDQDIPAIFRQGEIFTISGKLKENSTFETVTVFFDKKRFTAKVKKKRFTVQVDFLDTGSFKLGIIPGENGESIVEKIEVKNPLCQPFFEQQATSSLENFQIKVEDQKTKLSWESKKNNFFWLKFSQNEKEVNFFINQRETFYPPINSFKDFKEGLLTVEILESVLENDFSFSQKKSFISSFKKDFPIIFKHKSEFDETVQNFSFPTQFSLNEKIIIKGKTNKKLRENATIIEPNGEIKDFPMTQDEDGNFIFQFQPKLVGTFIIEINDSDGFAILNAPLFQQGFLPLLPDFWEQGEQESLKEINIKENRSQLLQMVNSFRLENSLPKLTLQENLNALAQFRADEMKTRDFFSHRDPDGKFVNDFRADHAVKTPVSENIALDINLASAHFGLLRSAIHRRNVLGKNFQKIGLGISKINSGEIIVVQLFAEEEFKTEKLENYRQEILQKINEKRSTKLLPNLKLDAIAQNWTEEMTENNFFAFENKESSLQSLLKNSGISKKVNSLIFQQSSVQSLIDDLLKKSLSIEDNSSQNPFQEENWKSIGIGILSDNVGNLQATIILSE